MKVKIENGVVKRISKLLKPSEADGEYIGIARVEKEVVDELYNHVARVMEEKGRRVFYEEAFQSMMDDGVAVNYETTRGLPWIEIDTPSDLMIARHEIYPKIQF
jgi:choline kinase